VTSTEGTMKVEFLNPRIYSLELRNVVTSRRKNFDAVPEAWMGKLLEPYMDSETRVADMEKTLSWYLSACIAQAKAYKSGRKLPSELKTIINLYARLIQSDYLDLNGFERSPGFRKGLSHIYSQMGYNTDMPTTTFAEAKENFRSSVAYQLLDGDELYQSKVWGDHMIDPMDIQEMLKKWVLNILVMTSSAQYVPEKLLMFDNTRRDLYESYELATVGYHRILTMREAADV
jgi:hypothetical protein